MTTPSTDRMEEARKIADQCWLTTHEKADLRKLIATALSASEAKGRQDGVREGMKRAVEIAQAEANRLDRLKTEAGIIASAILSNIDEANQ